MTHELSRRTVLKGAALGLGASAVLPALPAAAVPGPRAWQHGPASAARWLRTAYDVVVAQELTPPAAARAYAVGCLAGYEALLAGMPEHRSLAGQLTDLPRLPRPAADQPLDWPLVLNAAWATALRGAVPELREAALLAIQHRERAEVRDRTDSGVPPRTRRASRAHGQAVGRAVAAWFREDGHAEAVARPYVPPTGEAMWVPTPPNFGTAIEPYCESVRPMVLRSTDEVVPALPVPFSAEPGSAFWQQAQAVLAQSRVNTPEQVDIARFWTDNPRFSGLPAGHWLSIVVQVAEQHDLGLDETVEALALTAVTLHDAFLNCWTWKYRHGLLRPVTYVQRYVEPGWTTVVNTPQFPEYTSGHSVASRAAATVLTDLLGPLGFQDTSGATTAGLVQRTRTFRDFTAAADMAAQSRLYGGIHYPMGIELGKAQGDRVGELVIRRLRTRR